MGSLRGSGVRAKSMTTLHSGLAQMTADDYEPIHRCSRCGLRLTTRKKYCGRVCRSAAMESTWSSLYEKARASQGEWFSVPCSSDARAAALQQLFVRRGEFAVHKRGRIVSICKVAALWP